MSEDGYLADPGIYDVFRAHLASSERCKALAQEREEAHRARSEAIRMALDAEHRVAIRKAQLVPTAKGRNTEERSAALVLLCSDDYEWRELNTEAREHRSRQADIIPALDRLTIEIGLEEKRLEALNHLMGQKH